MKRARDLTVREAVDQLYARMNAEAEAHFARRRRRHQPRVRVPDGLLTMHEVAAKLRCSIKTLKSYVAAGELRYVSIGHGKKRPRKMFTDADLDALIATKTRKDIPTCPSTKTSARPTGRIASTAKVIAFSGVPRPRPGGKRKP